MWRGNDGTLFTSGRVGMIESLPGSINAFRAAQGFTFDVAPMPPGATGGAKAATGGGSGYGMYGAAKNVDAAWEFKANRTRPEVARPRRCNGRARGKSACTRLNSVLT